MAGCFMAICLAKRNYDVIVYESRPDVRLENYDSGRSFNLTLYYRGIKAMKELGVWGEAKKVAVIAQGNVAHYENRKVYDSFDAKGNEILYTVHRNKLNGALLTSAEKYENIEFQFNTKCVGVDSRKREVELEKQYSSSDQRESRSGSRQARTISTTVKADIVIGADGVNSVVRSFIPTESEQPWVKQYEDWGYKEVHISAEKTKALQLRLLSTHTWPRPDSLLIAFPNPDASFTLMFNLQLEGGKSFVSLVSEKDITAFITADFPDLKPLLPEIIDAFQQKKIGTFVTLYNPLWHDQDFMVLIGDAAHAFIPFYGQGMCAAFDDCLKFAELFDRHNGDVAKVFPLYQENRKRNTDLMAELAKENFIELRDKSRSPFFVFKDKADTLLHMLFPKFWQPPLYVLIAHGDLEYHEAYAKYQKQLLLSKKIGLDAALYALALPLIISGRFKKK